MKTGALAAPLSNAVTQPLFRCLPSLRAQVIHFGKMGIIRYQRQIVLDCNRGNPNVIFRDRTTFCPQPLFDLPEYIGSIRIHIQDEAIDDVRADVLSVRFHPS